MTTDRIEHSNPINPLYEGLDPEYFSRQAEEIHRGVDPDELAEMGYRSPLVDRLASDSVRQTLMTDDLPSPEVVDIPSNLELFRERFTWVPRYEQEINIAVNGLEDTLQGLHIRFVDEIRSNMQGYAKAANDTLTTLALGQVDRTERSSVSPRKIRAHVDEFGHRGTKGHHVILDEIATELFFADDVLTGKGPWPHRVNKVISPKRLKPYIAKVNTASNDQLVEMWNKTYESQVLRSKFWAKTLGGDSGDKPHPRIDESRREDLPPRAGYYRR